MQKNFAIAKISEGRGEKEVSGLFVRGECGVGAGGGRMRGAHRLPTFWGRNERGTEGGEEAATAATATAIFSNLRSAATTMI